MPKNDVDDSNTSRPHNDSTRVERDYEDDNPTPLLQTTEERTHTKSDSLSSPHPRSTTDHIFGDETLSATSDQPQPTDTTKYCQRQRRSGGGWSKPCRPRRGNNPRQRWQRYQQHKHQRGIRNETCTCRKPGYVNTARAVLSRVTDSTLRSDTQATCSQSSQYLGHFQKSASEWSVGAWVWWQLYFCLKIRVKCCRLFPFVLRYVILCMHYFLRSWKHDQIWSPPRCLSH